MNTSSDQNTASEAGEDILFECPRCGKSLEIDARGAGHMVSCPDCHHEIQVPEWDPAPEKPEAGIGEETRVRIQLTEMNEQLKVRLERLEKLRKADDQCFKRLADEITLIQSALDRITEIVESRNAED